MRALPNFESDIKWYTGAGCLICGSNSSPQGQEAGIQGVDFEVDDQFGRLGVCYSHARELGHLVGMVDKANLDAVVDSAETTFSAASDQLAEAEARLVEAKTERETVARLLAEFKSPPDQSAAPLKERKPRTPKVAE